MAFRIHEDQENTALGLRKDGSDLFSTNQRRALGDLSQFACNHNRNTKLVSNALVSKDTDNLFLKLYQIFLDWSDKRNL